MKFHSLLNIILFSVIWVFIASCDDNPASNEHDDEHFEAVGVVVYNGATEVARNQEGTVTGMLQVPNSSTTDTLSVAFLDEHGDEEVPHDDDETFDYEIEDEAVISIEQVGDWEFTITGLKSDSTTIRIKILHGDHADFVSEKIPVIVE